MSAFTAVEADHLILTRLGVVLARRWNTRALATLEQRHFRSLAPLQGGTFELLPAGA